MARIKTHRQKQKKLINAKWAEGAGARAKQIAVCPHCPEWFETTEARNAHRAGLPRTPKHRTGKAA